MTPQVRVSERLQEIQRQRGYLLLEMQEESRGTTKARSQQQSVNLSRGTTENVVLSAMESVMEAQGQMSSWGHSDTSTKSHGETRGQSKGKMEGMSPIIIDGEVHAMIPMVRDSDGKNIGKSDTTSNGRSEMSSNGMSNTTAKTQGRGRADGRGQSEQRGVGLSEGTTDGTSHNVTTKKTLLPNLVSEMDRTGQLDKGPIPEQMERLMQKIHCLSVAEALVCFRGERNSVLLKVRNVPEWWDTTEKKQLAIERIQARPRESRPYYFDPSEEPPTAAREGSEPFPFPSRAENSEKNPID